MGDRIRKRRAELGMTQAQLAQSAGISQGAVKKIERGGGSKHSLALAKALHVSVQWLVSGDGNPKESTGYWPFKHANLDEFERLPAAKKAELDIRISEFIAGALESPEQAEESKRA